MRPAIRKLRHGRRGAALVEYITLLALISVLVIGSTIKVGTEIRQDFDDTTTTLITFASEASGPTQDDDVPDGGWVGLPEAYQDGKAGGAPDLYRIFGDCLHDGTAPDPGALSAQLYCVDTGEGSTGSLPAPVDFRTNWDLKDIDIRDQCLFDTDTWEFIVDDYTMLCLPDVPEPEESLYAIVDTCVRLTADMDTNIFCVDYTGTRGNDLPPFPGLTWATYSGTENESHQGQQCVYDSVVGRFVGDSGWGEESFDMACQD